MTFTSCITGPSSSQSGTIKPACSSEIMGAGRVVQTPIYEDLPQIPHVVAPNPIPRRCCTEAFVASLQIMCQRADLTHDIWPEELAWQRWYPDAEFVELRSGTEFESYPWYFLSICFSPVRDGLGQQVPDEYWNAIFARIRVGQGWLCWLALNQRAFHSGGAVETKHGKPLCCVPPTRSP